MPELLIWVFWPDYLWWRLWLAFCDATKVSSDGSLTPHVFPISLLSPIAQMIISFLNKTFSIRFDTGIERRSLLDIFLNIYQSEMALVSMGSGPLPDLACDLWRRADLCNSRLTPIRLIQITLGAVDLSCEQPRHNNNSIAASLREQLATTSACNWTNWAQEATGGGLPPPSNWKSLSLTTLIMALVLFEERSHRPDPFAKTLTSFIRRMKPVRLIILRWVKWAICKMNYGSAQHSHAMPASAHNQNLNLKPEKENWIHRGRVC